MQYEISTVKPGAPGPSHLGTWDTTNPRREARPPGRPVLQIISRILLL